MYGQTDRHTLEKSHTHTHPHSQETLKTRVSEHFITPTTYPPKKERKKNIDDPYCIYRFTSIQSHFFFPLFFMYIFICLFSTHVLFDMPCDNNELYLLMFYIIFVFAIINKNNTDVSPSKTRSSEDLLLWQSKFKVTSLAFGMECFLCVGFRFCGTSRFLSSRMLPTELRLAASEAVRSRLGGNGGGIGAPATKQFRKKNKILCP